MMRASPPSDFEPDPLRDENDPVWNLLARAPLAEPDAWFAARTLARCRNEKLGMEPSAQNAGWFIRWTRMGRWAFGGGLGVCLAAGLLVAQMSSEKADDQKKVQEAFEIMATMDSDTDSSSSNSSWQDSSL
jgi:hypothetical protein